MGGVGVLVEEAEGIGDKMSWLCSAGRRSGTEEGKGSRESAYPQGRRKTVKVGWRDVNNHSSQCLQLCFCAGKHSLRAISQLIYNIT